MICSHRHKFLRNQLLQIAINCVRLLFTSIISLFDTLPWRERIHVGVNIFHFKLLILIFWAMSVYMFTIRELHLWQKLRALWCYRKQKNEGNNKEVLLENRTFVFIKLFDTTSRVQTPVPSLQNEIPCSSTENI